MKPGFYRQYKEQFYWPEIVYERDVFIVRIAAGRMRTGSGDAYRRKEVLIMRCATREEAVAYVDEAMSAEWLVPHLVIAGVLDP